MIMDRPPFVSEQNTRTFSAGLKSGGGHAKMWRDGAKSRTRGRRVSRAIGQAAAMPPPLLSRDPEGYYARLGVDPWAGPGTITAAYRGKARLVHPDVPGTGDANAFVELKRAYDVLISPDRRAAYD